MEKSGSLKSVRREGTSHSRKVKRLSVTRQKQQWSGEGQICHFSMWLLGRAQLLMTFRFLALVGGVGWGEWRLLKQLLGKARLKIEENQNFQI